MEEAASAEGSICIGLNGWEMGTEMGIQAQASFLRPTALCASLMIVLFMHRVFAVPQHGQLPWLWKFEVAEQSSPVHTH